MEEAGDMVVVVRRTNRPEKAVADFVPDRDDLERDLVRCEGVAYSQGVVV